jgi:hypothetical protein
MPPYTVTDAIIREEVFCLNAQLSPGSDLTQCREPYTATGPPMDCAETPASGVKGRGPRRGWRGVRRVGSRESVVHRNKGRRLIVRISLADSPAELIGRAKSGERVYD